MRALTLPWSRSFSLVNARVEALKAKQRGLHALGADQLVVLVKDEFVVKDTEFRHLQFPKIGPRILALAIKPH